MLILISRRPERNPSTQFANSVFETPQSFKHSLSAGQFVQGDLLCGLLFRKAACAVHVVGTLVGATTTGIDVDIKIHGVEYVVFHFVAAHWTSLAA
jgi:hypothetical protein